MHRILIVDDDRETCRFMAELLTRTDREVLTATQADDALDRVQSDSFDLLVSDINLNARQSGLDVLKAFKSTNPEGQVLLISGFGTLDTAIAAVRAGAFDYISKPFNIAQVKETVDRALAQAATRANLHVVRREAGPPELIGRTAGMLEVYKQIARAADSAVPVLVTGESGTGKELVARAIHYNSPRREKPLVIVNCAAIPEELLESELFGHVKGAFTGAVATHAGRFDAADGGTIFLDEIGDMSLKLQVKVLRVLQEQRFEPVGSTSTHQVDVRIIAATNQDLEVAVAEHKFREDLYYRLNVIPIRIPPLRERRADIPMLLSHFIEKYGAAAGRTVRTVSPAALERLMGYDWPGNVRELENLVERMVVLKKDEVIDTADLPPKIAGSPAGEAPGSPSSARWRTSRRGSSLSRSRRPAATRTRRRAFCTSTARPSSRRSRRSRSTSRIWNDLAGSPRCRRHPRRPVTPCPCTATSSSSTMTRAPPARSSSCRASAAGPRSSCGAVRRPSSSWGAASSRPQRWTSGCRVSPACSSLNTASATTSSPRS
jgi:DNA-binding NtrC family response regulator